MAVTGGYAPGTYQAADLNRLQSIFGAPGIARGMQVVPTTPLGMSVNVTVGAQGDGVCYLPNGGWVRIDAQLLLNVPSNSSGSTRNDAVVATMDPTGNSGAPSVAYVTNWAGGFNGGTTNQLVLALVSVANNATQITSGNITQNQAAASFGNASTAGTANTVGPIATSNGAYVSQVQTSTIGFGWGIIDNTASAVIEVMPVALSGTGRGMQLDYTDAANVQHPGVLVGATAITAVGAVTASAFHGPADALASISIGSIGNVAGFTANDDTSNNTDYLVAYRPGGVPRSITIDAWNGSSAVLPFSVGSQGYHAPMYVDDNGNIRSDGGGSIYLKYNTTGMRIFASAVTTGITFQKYDLLILLPFN